jgi:hypothetical protein
VPNGKLVKGGRLSASQNYQGAKKNSLAEIQQDCLNYLLIHQINQKACAVREGFEPPRGG